MADQALGLTLNGLNLAVKHQDKVWDPIHHRYKKMRGRVPLPDPEVYERRTMEEKGLVLRRRRDVGSDEEIVDVVRHKGEILPRRPGRPGQHQRASSMNTRAVGAGAAGGAAAGALMPYRDRDRDRDRDSRHDYYESEGSVPPRSRVRAKSTSGRSRRRRGSSSSSSSDSSLLSSTEEEKKCRKLQRKKWLTAALASVATIHAASKVYNSIEAHDKRIQKVQAGKLSPEDAHKEQRASRWQDAAAIGVAALGIKGAVGEWNEVSEEHMQHKELLTQREEHHKKRMERERRRRARERGGYYKGRDGHWYYDGPTPQSSESYRGGSGAGSHYDDSIAARGSSRARRIYEEDDDHEFDDRRSRSRRAVSRGRATDDY